MISVENLSKYYGEHQVLSSLSFKIERGEVVALLGPNGVGKSTLLKILSGYLLPSSGSLFIDGLNLATHSLQVRRRLGYLPETVAFYPEMSVTEYLCYRAALKKVQSRRILEKVIDVLDLCGLRAVEKKLIGTLSRGYRQRLGLADALVNEPDLLLLDEPTLGLDPKQQKEIHTLVKTLRKRHTCLISTHLLEEATLLAHRFLILNKGKIYAFGSLEKLQADFLLPGASLEKIFTQITEQEESDSFS